MPEVNLRSLTSDEPNTARVRIGPLIVPQLMLTGSSQVIYIHHNIPGVLRKGKLRCEQYPADSMLTLVKSTPFLATTTSTSRSATARAM